MNALNSGYTAPCIEGRGGLKIVRICNREDIRACLEVDGIVEYIFLNEGKKFFGFELPKHVSSFTITPNVSAVNGSAFYTEVVNLVINKMSASSSGILKALLDSSLCIIVEDYNGEGFLLGREHGIEVTSGNINSGTGQGDRNGYEYTLSAEEPKLTHIGRDFMRSFYEPTSDRYFILVNDNEFLIDSDNKFITY